MKLSLKYKFLGALIFLPVIALIVYAFMAKNVFVSDKMAYVYETSYKHNAGLVQNTRYKYENYRMLLKYAVNNIINSERKLTERVLKEEKSIISLRVFKLKNGEFNNYFSYQKFNDQKYPVSKDYFLSWYNKLHDRVDIDFAQSSDNVLKLLFKIPSSRMLVEGTFDVTQLSSSFKNDELYLNYLWKENLKTFWNKEKSLNYNFFGQMILARKVDQGVFEATVDEKEYIVSYAKVLDSTWAISLLKKDRAMSVLNVLKTKSVLFIIAILSFSTIFSVLASRRLTGELRELTYAAEEIGKGHFDYDLEINSGDEIEVLSISFNEMSTKISNLLGELEEYNRTLEIKVEERTMELKNAMDLQKTILDSVDQGFVLVDKDLSVMPIYSKASVPLFDGKPDDMPLPQLLHLDGSKADEIKTFFEMAIEEMMPFKDMMATAPDHFINEGEREVFLQYMPVRDENKKVHKVVLVATDKTDEIAALNKLENEKAKVGMVLKLSENKDSFKVFLKETQKFVSAMIGHSSNPNQFDQDAVFRLVHTLKGNASVYRLKSIVDTSHQFEEKLTQKEATSADLKEYIDAISLSLEEIQEEFKDLIGDDSKSQETGYIDMSEKDFHHLQDLVQSSKKCQKTMNFLHFLEDSETIGNKLSVLELEAESISAQLNKSVGVDVHGYDVRVPKERFDALFSNMIHLVRNAVDHGIEDAGTRKEVGKPELAQLEIKASSKDNQNLVITVQDDGAGINTEKLATKLKEIGVDLSAVTEEEMPYMIFHDGISTADEVSELSGRGVGVSALKEVVDELGGDIHIQTKFGQGTLFTITVPMFAEQKLKNVA
jgi:two-component system chemotaxis sensor kinase CheA